MSSGLICRVDTGICSARHPLVLRQQRPINGGSVLKVFWGCLQIVNFFLFKIILQELP
jgi:hypothetical protein